MMLRCANASDQRMYEVGGGTGRAPTLTTRMLSKWVAAEYEVFQIYAKHMISSCQDDIMGLCMSCTNIVLCGLCYDYHRKYSILPPIAYMLDGTRQKVRVGNPRFLPNRGYGRVTFSLVLKDGVAVTAL